LYVALVVSPSLRAAFNTNVSAASPAARQPVTVAVIGTFDEVAVAVSGGVFARS
jgi:hypothetical protein